MPAAPPQLLAPKFFMKWKQRHQVKYRFSAGGALQVRGSPLSCLAPPASLTLP